MSLIFNPAAYQSSFRRQQRRKLLLKVARWAFIATATVTLVLLSLSAFENTAVRLVAVV